MKIKINDVEIPIPYFCKNEAYKYVILSEAECIAVKGWDDILEPGIEQYKPSIPLRRNNTKQITRDEFMDAFSKVNQLLISKVSPQTLINNTLIDLENPVEINAPERVMI